MKTRSITFLTGTRADFGKLSALMKALQGRPEFQVEVIATGMHLLHKHGYTINEISKTGIKNVFPLFNQDSVSGQKMDVVLANTVIQVSHYITERRPDMLIVHGDRVEALASAISGSLNNILVGHIEGGEVSGTIDETMRHAISKMAHVHFVANDEAARRLRQLGERSTNIFVTGSPESDVMHGESLPDIEESKARYEIPFDDYAILAYHPVTTELVLLEHKIDVVLSALSESGDRFIVIRPNNDLGSELLATRIEQFAEANKARVRLFPSIRFEHYLTLLRHTRYIIGNSSSGVREAPAFGVPCVNIGTRQQNRSRGAGIFDVAEDKDLILQTLQRLPERVEVSREYGDGKTVERFLKILTETDIWATPTQKTFQDL